MKKKPSVIITFQESLDELINEVMNALPSDIKRFHWHIHVNDQYDTQPEKFRQKFEDALNSLRELGAGDKVTIAEKFTCDFIILIHENVPQKLLQDVIQAFKESFENTGKGQAFYDYCEQLIFCLDTESKNSYKNYNCYFLDSIDSNRNKIPLDLFFKKFRYLLLYFLTSNIHDNKGEWGFYFHGTNPEVRGEKTYKAIDIEYTGIPYIELNELFRHLVKEELCRQILSENDSNSKDTSDIKSLLKLQISQSVEHIRKVKTPVNDPSIHFFSSLSKKKEKADQFIAASENKSKEYEVEKLKQANISRIELEKKVTEINTGLSGRVLNYIYSKSVKLSDAQQLIKELTKKGGVIDTLLGDIKIEWPKSFRFSKFNVTPSHPKWSMVLVLLIITLLPWIIYEYIFFMPFDITLYVSLFGVIVGLGYAIFSLRSVRRNNAYLEKEYVRNLQHVDEFFEIAYRSFADYLESHLLESVKQKCQKETWDILILKIRWACHYLFNFYGVENFENNVNDYFKNIKMDSDFAKVELDEAIQEEMNLQALRFDEKVYELISSADIHDYDLMLKNLFLVFSNDQNLKNIKNLTERVGNIEKDKELFLKIHEVVNDFSEQVELNKHSIDVEKIAVPNEYTSFYLMEQERLIQDSINKVIRKYKIPSPDLFVKQLETSAKLKDHLYLFTKEINGSPSKEIDSKRFLFLPAGDEFSRGFKTHYVNKIFHSKVNATLGYIKIGTFEYSNESN